MVAAVVVALAEALAAAEAVALAEAEASADIITITDITVAGFLAHAFITAVDALAAFLECLSHPLFLSCWRELC